MLLKQRIKDDVIVAMKAKNVELSAVLRLVLAAVNSKEKEKHYSIAKEKPEMKEEELKAMSELTDEETLTTISSEIKKRRDAIALYEQGGRPELADVEKKEIAILQTYLPEQLSVEELRVLVKEAVAATGATTIKDMGKVMADLAPKVKGKAEGSQVSAAVKELLK